MLSWMVVLICFATIANAQYWTLTGFLTNAREYHTATLLPNGNVLVAGGCNSANCESYLNSAEVYNATTGVWTVTGSLTTARYVHTATLLSNGNVLVAGGYSTTYLNTAELCNAATGVWSVTGSLTYARDWHTATQLLNGNVLVAGGTNEYPVGLNSAEVYNPSTGLWTLTGSLTYARWLHTATLFPNGNVLLAGGTNDYPTGLNSAELYDPSTGAWTVTGSLISARQLHTATLLPNGNVLVAGGCDNGENCDGYLNSAEVYNVQTSVWTVTGGLTYPRGAHTATRQPDGNVLVAGGYDNEYLNSAELYNATTGVWTLTSDLTYARSSHTATLLPNGNVLVAGGEGTGGYLNSAEVYNGPNATATPTPTPSSTPTSMPTPASTPTIPTLTLTPTSATTPTSTPTPTFSPTTSVSTTSTPTPIPTISASPSSSSTAPTNTATMPTPTSSSTGSKVTPTPSESAVSALSSNAGAIAGGIIGGLVGLIFVLLLLWFLRSRYWNKKDVNNSDYTKPMIPMASSESERPASQVSDLNRSRSGTGASSFLSNRQSDDIYISFNSLKLGAVLGQGHFGQVYQADYTGAQVAVKKSKGINEKLILEEATMMKNLPPHPNVLHYYGVSQENGEFVMVTELCDKGNLAQYLRNPKNNLTSQQCRQFCRQIASGMWHISKYDIIHRDLRAENILLSGDNNLVAKVADFGLARSLNSHDPNDSGYYRMTELKEIPVSWTPPEVLNQSDQLKYFAASDVWSFGVLMWEIYSRGAKPFEATPVHAVIAMIRDPIRNVPLLPRPNNCPDDIFAIMNSCWAFNPQDRPTFEQLFNQLS